MERLRFFCVGVSTAWSDSRNQMVPELMWTELRALPNAAAWTKGDDTNTSETMNCAGFVGGGFV